VSTHGSGAYVGVTDAASSLKDISVYVNNTDYNPEQDSHDDTTYGATGHTYRGGLTNGTITISGMWDKTASTGSDTVLAGLLAIKTPWPWEFGPEGKTAGKVKKSGNGILTNYRVSAPVADLVSFTATIQISGAISSGTFP
jgi:hypothetical protein